MNARLILAPMLTLLAVASPSHAEDELRTPKPAQLPDLGLEVHHAVVDAGEVVDAGPPLLPDGGLAPVEPPDQATILRAIGVQQGAISTCVETEHRHHPGWLATKVTAGFTITPKGAVIGARLGDAKINKSKLGACLRAALSQVSLPPFDGEPLAVEVPLVLRNRGSVEPNDSKRGTE